MKKKLAPHVIRDMVKTAMKAFLPALVLAAPLMVAGCHKAPQAGIPELPPMTVRVQTVERKPLVATEDVVGTVRPKLSATIEAKVSGRIEQMLVAPGQSVKTGEMLVRLDGREIQARCDQAVATRQQAENDFKRVADLMGQKILSQAEFDAAESRFRVADAAVNEAKTMMNYTRITAPFDGVITRKLADVGDLAAPGKTLLQMENPMQLRIEADVPEALIGNVRLGDKLAVQITGVADSLAGVIAELSPAADPNSRTSLVKLDLPNAAGLRSGQFGRVSVPIGEVDSIRVPLAAVLQRGQMEMVFVVADGRAQLRLVKSGRRVRGEVEIVSGLGSGEQIVSHGAAELTDGQTVTIKP